MKLSKGDAVTYAALVAGAVLQALEPWRKEAAVPPETHPYLSSHAWSYFPLVLLTFVGLIWLYRQLTHRTQTVADKVEPPGSGPEAPQKKNVSSVRLVPSGDDLFCLVVTPGRGGVNVGLFLDWSAWQSGGIFWGGGAISPGWSTPQRFFLRDLHLRAASVKDSIEVLERFPLPISGNGAKAWRWRILSADGNPATTQPMCTSIKERAIFVFIDQHETKDEFPFLLVRANGDLSVPPIVVTPDDFASNTEV
jgi:hypothetical protein